MRVAATIEELPLLPMAVVRLVGLRPSSPSLFEDVLDLCRDDPAMALRVLRLANTATSGPVAPVETIRGAVARLGAQHVVELVGAVSVLEVFVPRTAAAHDLWVHAVEVGVAAQALSGAVGARHAPGDHAYLCGLLHDIGRFVMLDLAPQDVEAVEALEWVTAGDLIGAEHEVFGFDHAELGGRICDHWQLPPHIGEVVRSHHDPVTQVTGHDEPMSTLVAAADWLSFELRCARRAGEGTAHAGEGSDVDKARLWEALGLSTTALGELKTTMRTASAAAAARLGLRRTS